MTLHLKHLAETSNSTLSQLMLDGQRICYILEDGHREVKVPGQTRIPAGTYEIVQRTTGGFFARYAERFGHKFVPWLIQVPNFTYILIHLGNRPRDTRGCLLTGTYYFLAGDGDYWVKNSRQAYLKLYGILDKAFRDGQRVFIEIDRGQGEKRPAAADEDIVVATDDDEEFADAISQEGDAETNATPSAPPAPVVTTADGWPSWFFDFLNFIKMW